MKDVTLIMQGPLVDRTFEYLDTYERQGFNIILSTWEDYRTKNYKGKIIVGSYEEADKLSYLAYKPKSRYQVFTTAKALREVTTPVAIKHRTDEVYRLDKLIELFDKDPTKIVGHNIFYREHGVLPYHTSDKLQMGTTENLRMMYEKAWDYFSGVPHKLPFIPICSEMLLTMSYLSAKNELSEQGMDKYFDFVNFTELAPFVMRFNGVSNSDFLNEEMKEDFSIERNRKIHHIRWKDEDSK